MSLPSSFSVLVDGVLLNADGLAAIAGNPLTIALLSVVELFVGDKVMGAAVLVCRRRFKVVIRRRSMSVLLVDGLAVDESTFPPFASPSLVLLLAAV
jgi:hypothetical protein